VLARQHFEKFKSWIDASAALPNKPSIRLLTKSMTAKEK
jgi:RecG-like helicase